MRCRACPSETRAYGPSRARDGYVTTSYRCPSCGARQSAVERAETSTMLGYDAEASEFNRCARRGHEKRWEGRLGAASKLAKTLNAFSKAVDRARQSVDPAHAKSEDLRRLAALYGVPLPSRDPWDDVEVTWVRVWPGGQRVDVQIGDGKRLNLFMQHLESDGSWEATVDDRRWHTVARERFDLRVCAADWLMSELRRVVEVQS